LAYFWREGYREFLHRGLYTIFFTYYIPSAKFFVGNFFSKKFASIKILHEGYTANYFLNRVKTNSLFPILFIQNNLLKKKNQVPTFFIQLLHSVHFREILSGYFLFSRFDWSIFVTQLVAKHMKEIITTRYVKTLSDNNY
jgi:hypothetical protein